MVFDGDVGIVQIDEEGSKGVASTLFINCATNWV